MPIDSDLTKGYFLTSVLENYTNTKSILDKLTSFFEQFEDVRDIDGELVVDSMRPQLELAKQLHERARQLVDICLDQQKN